MRCAGALANWRRAVYASATLPRFKPAARMKMDDGFRRGMAARRPLVSRPAVVDQSLANVYCFLTDSSLTGQKVAMALSRVIADGVRRLPLWSKRHGVLQSRNGSLGLSALVFN